MLAQGGFFMPETQKASPNETAPAQPIITIERNGKLFFHIHA